MKLVEVGRITKPHGVRGEVKVRLHWEGSDALDAVTRVSLRRGDHATDVDVEYARPVAKGVLLKLSGVDGREAAEAYRDAAVCVARDRLPPLEDGEYYLADLVGARVVVDDQVVGEVVEVRMHPSVDSIVIRTPAGETREQALVEPWIERVDVDAGVVELSTTDGLV